MFEKVICVTTDLSPDALLTLQRIKELKPLGTNSCLLLQCQPIIDVDETTMTYLGNQYDKSLLRQQQYLIDAGLKVEGKVVYGLTRAEVSRIAREEGCSLIVSGAAEQTLFGGLLYGNIAYEIIYNSSQPVLLVRLPDGSEPPDIGVSEQNLLNHVLFSD